MSDLKKSTLQNIGVVGLSQVFLRLLSLTRYVIVARLLSPADLGLFALATAWLALSKRLDGLGLEAALIQKQDLPKDSFLYSFWVKLSSALFFFLLIWVSAPFIEEFYQFNLFGSVFRVLGLVLILNLPGYLSRIALTKSLYFKKVAFIQVLGGFVNVFSTITFALSGWGVWALVGGVFIGEATTSMLYFLENKEDFLKALKLKLSLKKINHATKDLFKYARPILGATLVAFLATRLDDLIVGKLLGPVELGFYSLAFTWGNLSVSSFTNALSRVFFPTLSKIQKDLARVRKGYLQALQWSNIVIAPICFGLIATAPYFIETLLGQKWLPAATALQILSLYGWFRGLGGIGGSMRKALGYPQIQFKLGALFLILMLIGIFPLTYRWGINGAACAVLIPSIVCNCLGMINSKKILSLKWGEVFTPLAIPTLLALVIALMMHFICQWASFIPAVIIGALLYLLTIWLVYRKELRSLQQTLKAKRGKS